MLEDFLFAHRASAMGRSYEVRRFSSVELCFHPSASSSAQSGALPKRERQTPRCTSSRRCLDAQSGTGESRGRHVLQSPDRRPFRLGVRDALVGFPLRLEM